MPIAINGSGTVTGISVGGLPDGIVDTDMLAANAVTAAKATGSAKGITMTQIWRISSNFSASTGFGAIDSNWEVADHVNVGSIGSSMSESSGVFTFPSTGIYSIQFICNFYGTAINRRYLNKLANTPTDRYREEGGGRRRRRYEQVAAAP